MRSEHTCRYAQRELKQRRVDDRGGERALQFAGYNIEVTPEEFASARIEIRAGRAQRSSSTYRAPLPPPLRLFTP